MSPPSATPSRSLSPVFWLVGFFCIFVLVGISHHSESPTTSLLHDRRSMIFLVHREDNSTIAGTSNHDAITTTTPLSSSSPSSSSLSTPSQSSSPSSVSSVFSSSHSSISLPEHSSSSLSSATKSITSSTSLSSSSAQSSTSSTPNPLRLTIANTPTSTLSSVQSIATTLALTDFSAPTAVTSIIATTSSTETGPTNMSSALTTSSSFWRKKGAVAATFTILAFVIVAISAIMAVTFFKKRNARQQRQLHEELFEKYSEDEHRSNSPGPSINAAPLDAFARRDVRHDSGGPFGSYPALPIQRTAPSISPVQHPDYYNQTPSRYLLPSQTQASARKPAPTSFREPVGREHARDSYQPSIDSFYGGAGQPTT